MPVCMSSPVPGHKASRGQTCRAAWQSKDQIPVCQPAQAALATQPHKTVCTCWMGFPQAQEPANWELSKVPAIFWEKNQPEQCGTRRHAVGSEGIAHQEQGLHSLHPGPGHIGRNTKVSTCK